MSSFIKFFSVVCYGTTVNLVVSTNDYRLTQLLPFTPLIIDGIVVNVGDTILVKDQIDTSQNGIYEVIQQAVTGITPYILQRKCMNLAQKHMILVKSGEENEETFWCADFGITPYTPGITGQVYNKVISVSLQEAYENSGSGPHIVLNTVNGCLHIADGDPALSDCLFKISNNDDTIQYLIVDTNGMCIDGGVSIKEKSSNPQPVVAGKGTLWVRDDSPNVIMYTDDDGNEFVLNKPTMQQTYDNTMGGVPEVVLDSTRGAVTFRDNATPIGGNLFEVQDNAGATTFFSVDATGASVDGKLTVTGLIDPTGITFDEQVTNPDTPVAGKGTVWIKDDTPNNAFFTDDAGIDWRLNGTLQVDYNQSTSPEIVLDATRGAVTIRDNSTPIGANLFEVQDNTGVDTYFSVDVSGVDVDGNAHITGDLTVDGTTTSVNTVNLLVQDRFIHAAANYNLDPAITAGLVMNCDPDPAVSVSIGGIGFVAGVSTISNPKVETTGGSSIFVDGDLIVISGANNPSNNGLFEVLSHTGGGDPETLTIRGIGTASLSAGVDFVQDQFITDSTLGGTITKTRVSVLRSRTDCLLECTMGDDATSIVANVGIIVKTLSSAGGTESLVATGTGPNLENKGLTAGTGISLSSDASSITINSSLNMQETYDNTIGGTPEIVLDATRGALTLRDNATPLGANLFEVQNNGGSTTYFSVDATGTTVDGKLTVTGLIDPIGLVVDEQTTVPGGAPVAGKGTYWIRDDIPNVPMFTDDTGTDFVLTATNDLQEAYNASTSPEIVLDATRGALTLQDNFTPLGANLFEVQSNGGGTTYFAVDATGTTVNGKLTVTGLIDPTGLVCDEQTTVPGGVPGTAKGTFWIRDDVPNVPMFTDDTGTDFVLTKTNNIQEAYDASTSPELVLDATRGALTIRDNSTPIGTNLLEIQNNGGSTTYFSVDASGTTIDGKLTVTGLIDPTGIVCDEQSSVPGGVPSAAKGTFWIRDDIPNVPMFTDDTGTDFVLTNLNDLQGAYDDSTSPEIILDSTRGALTIRDNSIPLGTNLFEIQNNGGGTTYFSIDATGTTVNGKLTVTGLIDPTGLVLDEQSSTPSVATAGKGVLWVKNDIPNILNFQDDAGTTYDLTKFTGHSDVPGSYAGAGSKVLAVNAGATAIEFTNNRSGTNTETTGTAVAFGSSSNVGTNVGAIAIGDTATSSATNATAMGAGSSATGLRSISIGFSSSATTDESIAIGNSANCSVGTGSIAIGNSSIASNIIATALGTSSNATASTSTALGAATIASATGALAVGAGSSAGGLQSIAIGSSAGSPTDGCISIGKSSAANSGTDNIAIGTIAGAHNNNAIAIGSSSNAAAISSIALGLNSSSTAINAITIGTNTLSSGTSAISIGNSASADNTAISIGDGATASALKSISIGPSATNDIMETLVVNGIPMIQNTSATGLLSGVAWAGSQAVIATDIINLKSMGTTTITLPSNVMMFVDQIDLVKMNVSAGPPTAAVIDVGITTINNKFISNLSFGGPSENTIGARVINTSLLSTDGVTSLTVTVNTIGTATGSHLMRVLFKGTLVRNE